MARVRTAQNAVINTASVQIKTLTVAGKQVTLAVFRQLIEEHIFDWATGRLRGVGWGHVRYLIDRPPEAANQSRQAIRDHLRSCIVERRLDPIWRRCLASVRDDPIVMETSQEVWTIRGLQQRVAQYSRLMEWVANPCRHKGERSRRSCANRRYGDMASISTAKRIAAACRNVGKLQQR